MRHAVIKMQFTSRPDVRVNRLDVRAIINAGLALRSLKETNDEVPLSDFMTSLGAEYNGWTAVFIETILDYAERERRFARRFRSWRRRASAR